MNNNNTNNRICSFILNNSRFFCLISSTLPLLWIQPASAGAYAKLAEANNAAYREVSKLGANPRPSDVKNAQAKHLAPAYKELSAEHRRTWNEWKKAIKAAAAESKAELLALIGEDGGAAATGANPPGEALKTPTGRIGAQTGTGCDGGDCGATGAKATAFGGKRQDNVPKVDDSGIIMEK